jgi:hypothetical protein
VKLVQALVKKGDPVQAAAVIRDLDRSMGGQPNSVACSAISSALVHEYTGNEGRLAESLDTALAACRGAPTLGAGVRLELARACLSADMEDGAAEVVRDVMRNAPNNAAMARAMGVLEQAGRGELAARLAQESRQHVVDLVASGAARAQAGDFEGAVALMLEAVDKMPDNPQVAFNAAVAVLKSLENDGWDERLGQNAHALIGTVRRLDPVNPKLPALAGLHQQILDKYNKGARAGKF